MNHTDCILYTTASKAEGQTAASLAGNFSAALFTSFLSRVSEEPKLFYACTHCKL